MSSVVSSVLTNVPLWCGMLMGEAVHVWGQEKEANSLRFPLSFAVNLKLLATLCLVTMSNSLQPYGLQRARLLCPWDSPGKNSGVGCHAFLQGSSQPRGWIRVSYVSSIGRQVLYVYDACVLSHVQLFAAPWTVASQAALSMGILPNPGVKPVSS